MTSFSSAILSGLNRAIETKSFPVEIVGTTSPSFLAWQLFVQKASAKQPRLVICPNREIAQNLIDNLKSIDPSAKVHFLEAFDEAPGSGLYPGAFVMHSRLGFISAALKAKPDELFIATAESIIQKTLPRDFFHAHTLTLKKNEEVAIDHICEFLVSCSYSSTPLVEDYGTFSRRGDILDIYSPTFPQPVRLEFFGDQIESIRLFNEGTQLSERELEEVHLVPAKEVLLTKESVNLAQNKIKEFCDESEIKKDYREEIIGPLREGILAHGIDFWFPYFYTATSSVLDYFSDAPLVFFLDSLSVTRSIDAILNKRQESFKDQIRTGHAVPKPDTIYLNFDELEKALPTHIVHLKDVHIEDASPAVVKADAREPSDLRIPIQAAREAKKDFFIPAAEKLSLWIKEGWLTVIFSSSQTQAQRLHYLLESHGIFSQMSSEPDWKKWINHVSTSQEGSICILPSSITESIKIESDLLALLKDEDFFGAKSKRSTHRTQGTLEQRTNYLSFGDLKPQDFIVHTQHGIGIYEGLKKMQVQGIEAEFLQIKYKDNDRLYLPVYRISQVQKYSSPTATPSIDKLGSNLWQKAKVKVRHDLKDVASELLELYAKRNNAVGFAFSPSDDDFKEFEATFPFDETPDQAKAISDVLADMEKPKPMDRLVCGDVGFGKTEVAIRASYKAICDKKQVAILVPTTVLAFQHFNTFKKRFNNYGINIALVSRFTPTAQIKKTMSALKEGAVDIIIGTHRLLSKDVEFKDLGLLVVDEEQKFGVTHKERIKRFKSMVDVLTLSATPIPRTLNMSLMGVRDLSLINTPPDDRLSIRTFICRFENETIRKAIQSEIKRGGQVYFIHNRVQSIYEFTEKIKSIVPEAKIKLAHGQMDDESLEKTMLEFYNHEFNVLISTTIIESGLDIPTANTIIIDRADTFGLSQLYQLRGRVGRSKDRAYAYLLIPPQGIVDKTAAERLKVLQDHSELGSGFQIAHHDLELRGSGNLLGEDQSGHISAVGYELYMNLLEQTLSEAKGLEPIEEFEPEINIKIPALIPDEYIEDIRIRLSYYKALSEIKDESDLEHIENELVDRFGPVPEVLGNLFGIMLIRRICKDIGIKDISLGPKNLVLMFLPSAKLNHNALIAMALKDQKKYQITPDSKLIIRFSTQAWAPILEELKHIKNTAYLKHSVI